LPLRELRPAYKIVHCSFFINLFHIPFSLLLIPYLVIALCSLFYLFPYFMRLILSLVIPAKAGTQVIKLQA
jgi:hypothetical protein